jgi:hypothetical protein
VVLQVVKPRGALDVGERLRAGELLPLEDLAAGQGPLELPDELLEVMLDDSVEVHQLAVDVVEDFRPRRHRAEEVERGAATEGFDVAVVLREQGDQAVRQATLSAKPGNDGGGLVHRNERGRREGARVLLRVGRAAALRGCRRGQ